MPGHGIPNITYPVTFISLYFDRCLCRGHIMLTGLTDEKLYALFLRIAYLFNSLH